MSPGVSFDVCVFFETPLAESQACRTRTRCAQLPVFSHICLRPPLAWLQHGPHRPCCQIRCGDPAELSLRMISCKSAISFPSVLIFFHDFFSLLAWHAYICLMSLNLALRLAFPGRDSR